MKKDTSYTVYFSKEHHSCYFYLEKSYRPHDITAGTNVGFFSPRLAYLLKGECTVILPDGQSLECKEGSVWFIPKNKPYKSIWRANGYIEFYAIEFDVDFISDKYTSFQSFDNTNTLPLFEKLFKSRNENNQIATLSAFYSILESILPKLEESSYEHTDQILPALNYLSENYTQNIKVKDLAKMCFMSESQFYQLFKRTTKTTPIEYKNSIKLTHAVNYLRNGKTLEEICEKLNFTSPAFLRRLLKKHFNKTPKEIKKEQILI